MPATSEDWERWIGQAVGRMQVADEWHSSPNADLVGQWVCPHCASTWPKNLGLDCLTCDERMPQAVYNGDVTVSLNGSGAAC